MANIKKGLKVSKPRIVMSVRDLHRDRFFNQAAFERLSELGDLVLDPDPMHHATEESKAVLRDAEIFISGWETGSLDDLLDEMPNLKLVAHSGGSLKYVIGKGAFARGIRMSSQTQLNAIPVAEYTLAMIMLSAKDVFASRRAYIEQRDKPDEFWNAFPHIGLYGANVGLIGLSRISRLVIEFLKPFHVNVKVFSNHLTEEQAKALGVTAASIEEIMQTCEVVSLHSASTPKTRHMIKGEHFAMMKDGATFINTARGAICDQDAMIEELKKDRIRAVIDVTDPEINVPDSPLWELPNVFLTPHAAGSMGRELFHLGDGTVDDVANFIAGKPVAGEFGESEYDGRA